MKVNWFIIRKIFSRTINYLGIAIRKKKVTEKINSSSVKIMKLFNETLAADTSCFTSYSYKIYLTTSQRQILVALNLAVMVLNLLANSAVLIVLLMSRLCQNTSYMLLFYLSLSDFFSGLLAQSLYAILIGRYFDQSYCSFEIIGQFFAVLLPHTSGYAIAAIAFDRYARMRFLIRYQLVVTKQKIIAVCLIITFVSLFEGLLYAFGSKFNFFDISKNVVHGIDFIVFVSVVIIYLLTMKVVRDHRNNSTNQALLKNINKTVTILASKILIAIVSFYGIYISIAVVYMAYINKVNDAGKSWLNFALLAGYLITYANSFANAVLFLTMNKMTKEKIMQFINNVLRKRHLQRDKLVLSTFSRISVFHTGQQSLETLC